LDVSSKTVARTIQTYATQEVYKEYGFVLDIKRGNGYRIKISDANFSLLRVKHLVLIVNGISKAEALKKMLTLELTTDFPATGLLLHPNFTIIADREAASLL